MRSAVITSCRSLRTIFDVTVGRTPSRPIGRPEFVPADSSSPTMIASSGGRRWTVAVALALVVAVYVLPLAGAPPTPNPNELVRVELAVALGVDGTVVLDSVARVYGVSEDVAVRGGVLLADKAPGVSMAAAPVAGTATRFFGEPATGLPPYWPLRHVLTALFAALPAALLAALLAWTEAPARPASTLTIVAFATPLWPYAALLFGHVAAAALIGIAWCLLLGRPTVTAHPWWRTLAGGAAVGLAISTEYPTVVLGAVVLAGFAGRRPGWQRVAVALVGVTVAFVPTLVYHQVAFGAPWLTGYAFKADPGFVTIHSGGIAGIGLPTFEGVWGVLFSLRRGLVAYAPWLALATVGAVQRIRTRRPDGWPLVVGLVAAVAIAGGFTDWTAGWCSAARHLLPALPLFVIAALDGIRFLEGFVWGRGLVGALVGASVIRAWATAAVTPLLPPEFRDPLAQVTVPTLADGIAAPTWAATALSLPAISVWIAVGLVAVAGVAVAVHRLAGRAAVVALLVACSLQLGQLAWSAAHRPPELDPLRVRLLERVGVIPPSDRQSSFDDSTAADSSAVSSTPSTFSSRSRS
jgi:hypothetical protein